MTEDGLGQTQLLNDLDNPAKVLATGNMKCNGILFRAHPHNASK